MKGQGLIEAVYSMGILGLVLTGVVVLFLMTVASKKTEFDRKKATELSSLVLEELVDSSKNDKSNFWILNGTQNSTKSGFDGYVYSVGFTNVYNDSDYPNCGVGVTDCANAIVKIDWQGKNPQSMSVSRFFTKNGN